MNRNVTNPLNGAVSNQKRLSFPGRISNYFRDQPFVKAAVSFIIIGSIIFLTFMIILILSGKILPGRDIDLAESSNIGGYIGGVVGSFWALAGVILLFAALRYQKMAFDLQTEEVKNNASVNIQQRFENTFFLMLTFQKSIIDDMKWTPGDNSDKEYTGSEFMKKAFEIFKYMFAYVKRGKGEAIKSMGVEEFIGILGEKQLTELDKLRETDEPDIKSLIEKTYVILLDNFDTQLKHYFRFSYNILLHIERAEDQVKDFKWWIYADILKASMSNIELTFCFYDALHYPGFDKLYKKYQLNNNLKEEDFINPGDKNLL